MGPSAVEKAFRTEFVVQQGKAKLELALLSALGRREEASSEAGSAPERFAAKATAPEPAPPKRCSKHSPAANREPRQAAGAS